ncbi:hypothetical protein LTR85_008916 [Meristemomyces frigidus]|nr:hypothetical protein LTR85_008916 [Meristemomyces frigidus]
MPRRTPGPRPVVKEQGRSTSSDWIDIDESPPRRRRSSKRNTRHSERSSRDSHDYQRGSASEVGGFFPRLSRILEANESTTSSRPTTRGSDTRRHRESAGSKRQRHHDDTGSVYKRPVRHRTNATPRRNDSLLKINPSLLSVLSSLTRTSDRSSGSGSTVTQKSYDRRGSDSSRTPTGRPRRYDSDDRSTFSSRSRPMSPNVFDYMVPSTAASSIDEGRDDQSVMSSSSSSHYEPSITGSSEAPDTPSSRSTFPSPTNTRSQSVAELRRKYDPQYSSSNDSVRSDSHSPDSSVRSARKQPSVSDVAEDDEESVMEPTAPSELSYDPRAGSSSRSSRSSQRSNARLQKQEDHMRQHMAYAVQAQQGDHVDPVYGQHRSPSNSSAHSDQAAYAYHMAMQQYQWPSPPAVIPQTAGPPMMNGHVAHSERPPAPDAPDLTQHTVAGYEMLALELSSIDSPVKPLYRKFKYLNHRILLHLQDELCELEEQLRVVDEIIAQMDPAFSEGQTTPASRRGEAYSSSEIHHRRTSLLGRIFIKTEQYNRAMTSYATMAKSAGSPEVDQVQAYQQWMCKHAPVHEIEARFLHRGDDLMVPGKAESAVEPQPKHAALAYLPVTLMLPLLLFSIIPTLAGRLAVTALIAVGAFIVAATTRIRHLMPPREWAVCGAAYVLLMSAIAGCIPQHAT